MAKPNSKSKKTPARRPLQDESPAQPLTGKGKFPFSKIPLKRIISYLAIVTAVALVFFIFIGPGVKSSINRGKLKDLNVIFITLDTLRADFVGVYKKGKAETPSMDAVANEGVVFENCISQSPLTLPSHTTMLTGTYPTYHQIRDNGGFLVPDSLEFVSEVLKKNGFTTSAFIASYVLHSKWGINQGFDYYSDDFDLSRYEKISLGNVQKRAQEVLADAQKWLIANREKRFFSWIHLYDPHTPYDPPPPFAERFANRPYRGEVEYMDQQLGLFFEFLKNNGLYDRTLIIMAADHGESLGQHGEQSHGFFIYETTVHVPLIIRSPFHFPVSRVSHLVELADIAPTILDVLGITIPATYQGQSLVNAMFGDSNNLKKTAYSETYYPRLHYGWSELKALYHDNSWKYIQAPREELYDLENDETEENNLSLKESGKVRRVRERLNRLIQKQSQGARKPGEALQMKKDDLQRLAALGYITTFIDTSGKTDLPDPKGKVMVFNDLDRAREHLHNQKYQDAIDILLKIIADNPQIVDGMLLLGNVYAQNNQPELALETFYKILDQKPDYHAAMINILNALGRMEQFEKAKTEAIRFLKIFPGDHTLMNELGAVYYMIGDYQKARGQFDESIKLEPVNSHAFNYIGAIHFIDGHYDKAREFLAKARDINPSLRRLNFHLAQVEEAQGNHEKALAFYREELRLFPEAFKAAYNAAEILRKAGRNDEAAELYKQAITGNPGFNIPYFMIAKYHLDRKSDLETAEKLCLEGIKLPPENKYTVLGYLVLADICAIKGDPRQSEQHLTQGNRLKQKLIRENRWN